jgi:hypothetical protein
LVLVVLVQHRRAKVAMGQLLVLSLIPPQVVVVVVSPATMAEQVALVVVLVG